MDWVDAHAPSKREQRIKDLRTQLISTERELLRLENLAEDPGNAGTIVRWRDTQTGIHMAAHRQSCGQWDVTGVDMYRTWDELMDLVGHATLEIADSFTTLMKGTES